MKKLLSVIILAAALTTAAFAQVTVGARGIFAWNLGTSAAGDKDDDMSFAYLVENYKEMLAVGGDTFSEPFQFGGGFGIFARYNLPKVKGLGFQAEADVNFNNAYKWVMDVTTVETDTTFSYTSLDIPLLVTYDLNAGPVLITFMAGPNFSFPLGKFNMTVQSTGAPDDKEKMDFASHCLVGITGGVEAAYKVGPGKIAGGVRYLNDFMYSVFEQGGNEEKCYYRRALQVNLGYNYTF